MKWLFVHLLLFVGLSSQAQVPVISFSELQKIIATNDDTLRVINFWATWCKPCVEELPHFEKLTATYKGKPLKVLLISMDFKNKVELVAAFAKRKQLISTVLLLDQGNPNDWIDKISPDWSGAIPATLFVGGKTKAYQFHEGDHDFETLHKTVQLIL
jgi:thiol-disulfide isomerase/thioredoxin